MTCCTKQQNTLTKPLLQNPPLAGNSNYGSSDMQGQITAFSTFASLLDPSGQLSEELLSVLDEVFMKYSDGLLIMTKQCLIRYYKACYPSLSQEKYYDERAQYVLNKYGKKLSDIQQNLRLILKSSKDSKSDKQEIVDMYSPHSNRRRAKTENASTAEEETKYSEEAKNEAEPQPTKLKQHSMTIKEDKSLIESTINCEVDASEIVMLKTKFLLMYRKSCVDKPMMVRLELTELGQLQFKSGMVMDRTKQLDKLAFNIQQLRNRFKTHEEEMRRINNAASPNECAINIEQFIQNNTEPLDLNSHTDANNLFRKRRPFKFNRACHTCCCCVVACVRCCCE